MGGIKANNKGEIEGPKGSIPGLYAAGEVMGGVHGKNRLGGNSLLDCVVYGRVAGASVMNSLKGGASRLNTLNKQVTSGKTFTAEEVAKHKTKDDCWVILHNKVYNVTNFLDDHPGGAKAILIYGGKDATEQFDMLHEMKIIKKYGKDMYVGDLSGSGAAATSSAPAKTEGNHGITGPLVPSNQQSLNSGGTADILPNERKNATFDITKMTNVLDGGVKQTARRKFIYSPLKNVDMSI